MKNSFTRLSVIIPGYNTPDKWWDRAVKSVLLALGADDEVILVDDGSSIPLRVEQFEWGGDSRVKFIGLEKNCGQAGARNRGLDVASGKYLTFVDSDDEIVPDIYGKCLKLLESADDDIIVFGVKVIWCRDGLYKADTLPEEHFGVPSPIAVRKLYKACLLEYPVNKVYRRAFLDNHGIRFKPGVCPGEDTAFNLACLIARAKVTVIPDIGYVYYRMDGTTLSRAHANIRKTLLWRTELWRKYKALNPGMRDALGMIGEYSELDILRNEWRNMWRLGSVTTWRDRWCFIKSHKEVEEGSPIWGFIRMLTLSFLRGHFYFRPIRRWHIKRLYPKATEWRSKCN